MKKLSIFVAVLFAAILMSSCSTYTFTSRSTEIEKQKIATSSLVVDIRPDFAQRINVESGRWKTAQEACNEAKYLAVTANNCDVIVDPIYKIEKRGSKFKAYLTGFAGYFQNPRTLIDDIKLFKDVKQEDINKYLILQDPEIIGLMNQTSGSEVINIYEGKACVDDKPAKK